jgi:phosphoenolpyruvate synthase/pyruvate phosphate dikinase
MNWILPPEEIDSKDRHRVGGKGYALSLLVKGGFKIPRTVCITSDVYQEFVLKTGLRERILLELHRKDFKSMRWEEIWDCATRIRNMFLTKQPPDGLAKEIRNGIGDRFRGRTGWPCVRRLRKNMTPNRLLPDYTNPISMWPARHRF